MISRTEKIPWWPLFLKLIFTYFPIMTNSGKLEEISSTSCYCIIPPFEWVIRYNIWKLTQLRSFFTTPKLKKQITESRLFLTVVFLLFTTPASIYLFKVNNRNTRTRSEICSKLTTCSSVSIVNFEQANAHWDTNAITLTLTKENF